MVTLNKRQLRTVRRLLAKVDTVELSLESFGDVLDAANSIIEGEALDWAGHKVRFQLNEEGRVINWELTKADLSNLTPESLNNETQ